MKRFLIVLISQIMVLSLTACGGGGEDSASEEVQTAIPKYSVQIELDCVANLLFSKYDVDIYVDETEVGTLDHGATETFEVDLEAGNHTIKVTKENESDVDGEVKFTVSENKVLRYTLSLSSSQVEIEEVVEEELASGESDSSEPSIEESTTSEEPEVTTEPESEVIESIEDAILTVDNSEDLAAILATHDESDPLIKEFADKYKGRTVKFDGNVTYMSNHDSYDTRFDILIGAGDYDENRQQGPNFKFKDVNASELGLDTLFIEDVVQIGKNLHFVAVVGEYNQDNTLFELDPISVEGR